LFYGNAPETGSPVKGSPTKSKEKEPPLFGGSFGANTAA